MKGKRNVNKRILLASHFSSFLAKGKLVARKQGRCAEKASAGKEFQPEIRLCFRRMWRARRAPSRAPLQRNNPPLGQRTACPPGLRNEKRLMVFSRNALVSGPGNPGNSTGGTHITLKVNGARQILLVDFHLSTHVGVRAGGIWIIRLGGITPFE
jgi:hypothetical protein